MTGDAFEGPQRRDEWHGGVYREGAIAMALPRIHHVQVAIPPAGEERARQFYGTLLGLEEVSKPASLQQRGGVWFATGNLQLHLGVDAAFQAAHKAHVALEVQGLETLRARLEGAGYHTTEDEPLSGYQRCYVGDPFGNRTELLEPDDDYQCRE